MHFRQDCGKISVRVLPLQAILPFALKENYSLSFPFRFGNKSVIRLSLVKRSVQRKGKETIVMLDSILRGGTLIDGSGAPGVPADLAIQNGKIAAIGNCSGLEARRSFDVRGKCVTPGFLDIHRHADAAVFRPGFGEAELRQGLTTIINGNCGLSLAPFGAAHRAEILQYLRPITGAVSEQIETDSMDGYLRGAAAQNLPIHVGMLVGNGILRADGFGYEDAPISDYAPLHRAMEKALAEGAFGVSLGLGYAPECFYSTEALIRALAPLQGSGIPITVHMREEGSAVLSAIDEMLTVCRALHTPVHISHLKAMGKENWGNKIPQALAMLRRAREDGLPVSCDVYPYTAGSTQLLHILPQDFLGGGLDAVVQRLRDPGARRELSARLKTGTDFDNISRLVGWENILLSTLNRPENKKYEGKTAAEIAKARGQEPDECIFDLLADERCAITMIDFIASEQDIAQILQDDFANVISDSTYPTEGMPHPRVYGTFARMIEKYVCLDKVLSLEQAVRKMTQVPADVLGLRQKGRLAVGADADILVFAPEAIRENATYQKPCVCSDGFETVFVGGETAIENGRLTGSRSGGVLRR